MIQYQYHILFQNFLFLFRGKQIHVGRRRHILQLRGILQQLHDMRSSNHRADREFLSALGKLDKIQVVHSIDIIRFDHFLKILKNKY